MEISGTGQIFFFGCLGGVALETLRWLKLSQGGQFPAYAHKPAYWVLTAAMIGLGGLIAVVYGTSARPAILVLNLGASAPAIIAGLAKPPDTGGGSAAFQGAPRPHRLRRFLAFG